MCDCRSFAVIIQLVSGIKTSRKLSKEVEHCIPMVLSSASHVPGDLVRPFQVDEMADLIFRRTKCKAVIDH